MSHSRVSKVLLVAALAASPGVLSASLCLAQCPLPPQYLNSATAVVGDLTFTAATDRAEYVSGDPALVYMSIFNTGSSPVVIPNPASITPMNSWVLYSDACPSWDTEECIVQTPLVFPFVVYYFGPPLTVNPAECKVFTATWDGLNVWTHAPAAPGAYTLKAGMTASPGYSFFMPEGGISLPVRIDPAGVPAGPVTWGGIKAIYRS